MSVCKWKSKVWYFDKSPASFRDLKAMISTLFILAVPSAERKKVITGFRRRHSRLHSIWAFWSEISLPPFSVQRKLTSENFHFPVHQYLVIEESLLYPYSLLFRTLPRYNCVFVMCIDWILMFYWCFFF